MSEQHQRRIDRDEDGVTWVTDLAGVQHPLAVDWGVQAQLSAERHLERCLEYQEAVETSPDDTAPEGMSDPSIAPFCGCTTCITREVVAAAAPFLVAGFAREAGL